MLAVQAALRGGASLVALAEELHLNVFRHPDPAVPLVGLKYNQLDSPKLHPVVRECRGIVLEEGSWSLVAKGFNRFFNVGEDGEDFAKFDWSDFSCTSKEDGSLILLYYYANEWRVNTSGSFAFGDVQGYATSWCELFWATSGIKPDDLKGLEEHTLVFEMCTPYNRVVRRYETPRTYLLSTFVGGSEVGVQDLYARFLERNVRLPESYRFSSNEKNRIRPSRGWSFETTPDVDSSGRRRLMWLYTSLRTTATFCCLSE